MPDNEDSPARRRRRVANPPPPRQPDLDPTEIRNTSDPGDATGRNFRYQHAYGVVLMAAAKRGERPYLAVWCEHHEDFLAERHDGRYDGWQIKTSKPERGPWTLRDTELVRAIGRFVELVTTFEDRIADLYFVSNKAFDEVGPNHADQAKRARCPGLFLEHLRSCATHADIAPPFDGAFATLQAECGCGPEEMFGTLRRVRLVLGPSRGEFEAALSHEHLGSLEDCRGLSPAQLDGFRDDLIGRVHRASTLQVTDPFRHLRALAGACDPDPVLAAKRLVVDDTIVYRPRPPAHPVPFTFPGVPEVVLGQGVVSSVLEQKLDRGGIREELELMDSRARAAEYNLLEDVQRRPEAYPALQRQLEQLVLGECAEAHLRGRQSPPPYGPAMLIEVQNRLRRLAEERPAMVGQHQYECLIGMAAMLTGECRVWWSPRFTLAPGTV